MNATVTTMEEVNATRAEITGPGGFFELEEREMSVLQDEELPEKERKLVVALEKAEHAVREAEVDLEKTTLRVEMSRMKARWELEGAERKLAELEEEEEHDDDEGHDDDHDGAGGHDDDPEG